MNLDFNSLSTNPIGEDKTRKSRATSKNGRKSSLSKKKYENPQNISTKSQVGKPNNDKSFTHSISSLLQGRTLNNSLTNSAKYPEEKKEKSLVSS